jgi:hypothetical protein
MGASGTPYSISAGEARTATVTQGDSAAFLELLTAKLDTLNVTSGNSFTLSGASTPLPALQVVTANVSKGTFTAPALAAVSSLTVSGSGSTSAASIGSLGGTAVAYPIAVTASGLKGGLTLGTSNVAEGFDISIDVSGIRATATSNGADIGDIGYASANKVGAVTVNATGVVGTVAIGRDSKGANGISAKGDVTVTASPTGTFNIGNIDASTTGNVKVNLDGTLGAVTIGTFTGKSVTVDASDTLGGVTGPTVNSSTTNTFDVTAMTAADVSVSTLAASQVSITAATASTGLAVTLTGGTLVDTVTVTGKTTPTSLVLTGDLGLGSDSVTVNGTSYSGSGTQTISVAGLASYNTATLNGSGVKDAIVGGSGVDTIDGGVGADVLTGGAGADNFLFSMGDSKVGSYDTITDLGTTDVIKVFAADGTTNLTLARAADKAKTATTIGISSGIVDFAGVASTTTLADKVTALNALTEFGSEGKQALFTHEGVTFMYVSDATTANTTDDLVIALTGVVLSQTGTTAGDGVTTGLAGFGA